jgi:cystathionine beta-lyase/cystathionine gamma-synthase
MKIETLAVHAGQEIDPTTGAVTPPIHLSTTFEREPDGDYPKGYIYAAMAFSALVEGLNMLARRARRKRRLRRPR